VLWLLRAALWAVKKVYLQRPCLPFVALQPDASSSSTQPSQAQLEAFFMGLREMHGYNGQEGEKKRENGLYFSIALKKKTCLFNRMSRF
jgi:hypothetical protein